MTAIGHHPTRPWAGLGFGAATARTRVVSAARGRGTPTGRWPGGLEPNVGVPGCVGHGATAGGVVDGVVVIGGTLGTSGRCHASVTGLSGRTGPLASGRCQASVSWGATSPVREGVGGSLFAAGPTPAGATVPWGAASPPVGTSEAAVAVPEGGRLPVPTLTGLERVANGSSPSGRAT
jgi:hypothetical protein